MIRIDYQLYCLISNFLNSNTDGNRLLDLNNIVYCKKFRVQFIKDITDQTSEKAKEFAKENFDYLVGNKDYDIIFDINANEYLRSLELAPDTAALDKRLEDVIRANTYYPIDAKIKEKVKNFLQLHEDVYDYLNQKDIALLNELIETMYKAIFDPRKLVDPNYDQIVTSFNGDFFKINLYHYEHIFNILGQDDEAERLYNKLLAIKQALDYSSSNK